MNPGSPKPWKAQAWLFDLDGTLVDTAPDLGHAANKVRAETGLGPLPLAAYRPAASSGARGLLAIALGLKPEDPAFLPNRNSFLAHYRAGIARTSRPFPGIPELLLMLDLRGLRWGVVTNKPDWLTQALLAELGLLKRCACVISGDTAPKPKPAADPLLLACRRLALKPRDCVYVGDDLRDIQSAKAAKMRSVAAAWGYLGGSEPIGRWGADAIVETPAALQTLVG
ncbi:MAG: HAD family hydrolase [Panacagrimonas sp.]